MLFESKPPLEFITIIAIISMKHLLRPGRNIGMSILVKFEKNELIECNDICWCLFKHKKCCSSKMSVLH